MGEPYTIRIFVLDGDPGGAKIVDRLNWTGLGLAFPRASWPRLSKRSEFERPGVYVLTGTSEGTADDLPTVYIGQGDEIRNRLDSHYAKKDFWDWGFIFVSKAEPLNRAHTTWLEHSLIYRAKTAQRCHLDNEVHPKEPNLSESDKADTEGFLREVLRILPLLGVQVFEKPSPVALPGISESQSPSPKGDARDTIVVPAQEEGFQEVFIGERAWYAIRISGGMIPKIKYIAAYRTYPISAITHYAPVEKIEPYGDEGKYRLVFAAPAKEISSIPFGDAPTGTMQGPRYTSLERLLKVKSIGELVGKASPKPGT